MCFNASVSVRACVRAQSDSECHCLHVHVLSAGRSFPGLSRLPGGARDARPRQPDARPVVGRDRLPPAREHARWASHVGCVFGLPSESSPPKSPVPVNVSSHCKLWWAAVEAICQRGVGGRRPCPYQLSMYHKVHTLASRLIQQQRYVMESGMTK